MLAPGVQAQPELVSPSQQVLRACANTYKSLREFKGSAAVISQSRVDDKKYGPSTDAQIADANFDFVRDQHFDIEGHDTSHNPYRINGRPQKTTTYWKLGDQERNETAPSVGAAVNGFTGVAGLAPSTVPALLLELDYKYPFNIRADATLQKPEVFGGHLCFVVTQKTGGRPTTRTLWIDTQTFLLRGMREESGTYTLKIPAYVSKVPGASTPAEEDTVFFSNRTHVFSIEKTLPTEDELAATARQNTNLPPVEAEAKRD